MTDAVEEGTPIAAGGPEDCNTENAVPVRANATKPAIRKRRLQRKGKRKRSSKKSCAREVAVYSGTTWLGMVKIASTGRATAFCPDGERIGVYTSQQAALDALRGGVDG
jgi:hypothetical protein